MRQTQTLTNVCTRDAAYAHAHSYTHPCKHFLDFLALLRIAVTTLFSCRFFGNVNRVQAEDILKGCDYAAFLVRNGFGGKLAVGGYAVSLWSPQQKTYVFLVLCCLFSFLAFLTCTLVNSLACLSFWLDNCLFIYSHVSSVVSRTFSWYPQPMV